METEGIAAVIPPPPSASLQSFAYARCQGRQEHLGRAHTSGGTRAPEDGVQGPARTIRTGGAARLALFLWHGSLQ